MDQGVDSSTDRPTPDIARQAYQSGVRMWGGYLTTTDNPTKVGLAAAWSGDDWAVIRDAGIGGIAFCSGWDDPGGLHLVARELGLLLCLDVESGIRGDGDWVGPWLQASGAGLYGLGAVHYHPARFRILALYPGHDPAATWYGPPPPEPHGWQYQGTHQEWGISVDRAYYDHWFWETTMLLNSGMKVGLAHLAVASVYNREPSAQEETDFANTLNDDGSNLADLVQQLASHLGNQDLATIQPSHLAQEVAQAPSAGALPAHHHPLGVSGPAVADA